MSAPAVAFSYIRFSHPDQAKGDSLRRQTEAAATWCEHNQVRLDTALTLHDLGKSAFTGAHRKNPDRHALAAFLKLIETGRVPRGSYLLIENLDRLSREDEVPACHLLTGILMDGVKVVQLSPYEMLLTEKSNGWELMRAVMELSRGHGESAVKSVRVGAAWAQRRKRAREAGAVLTRRLPAWVEERGGKLQLIPERAAAVKRIFELAAGGYGLNLSCRKLTEEGVPAFGPSGIWQRAYLAVILTDRRAVGEFQPKGAGGKPDGKPIAGYFPAVVTEQEWLAARACADQRRKKPGRTGEHVNVFAGLLKDARSHDAYYSLTRNAIRGGERESYRILITTGGSEGRYKCVSFPLATFERGVLALLREVDPREILGTPDGPDEVLVLSADLARVEAQVAATVAELDEHGESPALFKRLREKETLQHDLTQRLAQARQKAANPLSEAWGECQSLLDALDKAPDQNDARLRLRSALRRIVASVWMLVVPRGRCRLCVVQVWFHDHGRTPRRDYLLLHLEPRRNARGGRPGGQWVGSLADFVGQEKEFDLHKRDRATALATLLQTADLEQLCNKAINLETRG